jgi:hypothetical protein
MTERRSSQAQGSTEPELATAPEEDLEGYEVQARQPIGRYPGKKSLIRAASPAFGFAVDPLLLIVAPVSLSYCYLSPLWLFASIGIWTLTYLPFSQATRHEGTDNVLSDRPDVRYRLLAQAVAYSMFWFAVPVLIRWIRQELS